MADRPERMQVIEKETISLGQDTLLALLAKFAIRFMLQELLRCYPMVSTTSSRQLMVILHIQDSFHLHKVIWETKPHLEYQEWHRVLWLIQQVLLLHQVHPMSYAMLEVQQWPSVLAESRLLETWHEINNKKLKTVLHKLEQCSLSLVPPRLQENLLVLTVPWARTQLQQHQKVHRKQKMEHICEGRWDPVLITLLGILQDSVQDKQRLQWPRAILI